MTRKILFVVSMLVLASVALAACGGATYECEDELGCVTYAPDEPIRIASALVITGPNADLGLDSQYGVEIAIDEAGEVAGHPVAFLGEILQTSNQILVLRIGTSHLKCHWCHIIQAAVWPIAIIIHPPIIRNMFFVGSTCSTSS